MLIAPVVALAQTPRYAYVANNISNNISAYTINPSTGALTEILPRVAAGSFPQSVTMDPLGLDAIRSGGSRW